MRRLSCLVVGDGPLAERCRAAAKEAGHRVAAATPDGEPYDARFRLVPGAAPGALSLHLGEDGEVAWCGADGAAVWRERDEAGGAGRDELALDGFLDLLTRLARGEALTPLAPRPAGTGMVPATPATLHGLFEAAARRRPAALALAAGDLRLSYAELQAAADGLALALRAHNGGAPLPPDSLVGLYAGRSAALLIGILGILKAGGAYLPLDPDYPAERLRFMLQDAAPFAVVAEDPAAAATALGLAPERIVAAAAPAAPGSLAPAPAGPGDLAYVIYTSGSTGRPKGVALQHAGACNMAEAHCRLLRIAPDDAVLQFASISFDASVAEIFPAFVAGAALHLAGEAERHSPERLHAFMAERHIAVATLMASVAGHLPQQPLLTLHGLMLAGETAAAETVAFWSRGRRLLNGYGPTEASVSVAVNIFAPGDPPNRIGSALPNVTLQVLDPEGQPAETGELCVGGVQLARGYLNRPELTGERFFHDAEGHRLYRTGDLVRWAAPGLLDYVGRRDDQVKVAGIRVELDEVRLALDALPGVQQSAVLRQERDGRSSLVACYVPSAAPLPEAALVAGLARRLPEPLIPARFLALAALPLGPTSKVDRQALTRLVEAEPRQAAPETPLEAELARLWCEALRVASVGRNDNFFSLGGDSLRLTWLLQRLSERYGTALVAAHFRALPTLADLARYIEQEGNAAGTLVEDF